MHHPCGYYVDGRHRMLLPERQFFFARQTHFLDMLTAGIHSDNQGQCMLRQCLAIGFRIEKFPTCMGHTSHHRDAGHFGIAVIHSCSVRLQIALIIRKYFLCRVKSVSSVMIEQQRLPDRIIVDQVTTLLRSYLPVAIEHLYRRLSLSLLFSMEAMRASPFVHI